MFHSKVSIRAIKDTLLYAKKTKNILFVGICGTGMSALARLLKSRGFSVFGYDDSFGGEYARLCAEGIPVFNRVDECDLSRVGLVVYTLAMPEGHPLLSLDVPSCSRAQLLGAVMLDYPVRIAVAGSHGKSTVTSLIHRALVALGTSPTTLSGADLGDGIGTLSVGDGEIFLYECCEYCDSFLYTSPTVAVLLNLELDHTDYFRDLDHIKNSFVRFANLAREVIYFAQDENLSQIAERITAKKTPFYLFSERDREVLPEENAFVGVVSSVERAVYSYTVYENKEERAHVRPLILGEVGAKNTLATLCVLSRLGYSSPSVAGCLSDLPPISRRLFPIGSLAKHPVFYDFAHHPSEILSTIRTLTEYCGTPPTVIFAPHTYSRTRDLWDGFVTALSCAGRVFLCPIYPARELPIENITSEHLALAIGERAHLVSTLECSLTPILSGEEPLVLMGAGDVANIKKIIETHSAFRPKKAENI